MGLKFVLFWIGFVACSCKILTASATELSANDQRLISILEVLGEKVQLQTKTIQENHRRLETLEKQIAQQKVLLETTSSGVANIDTEIKKIEDSSKCAKANSFPKNCLEVKQSGHNNTGIFSIQPKFASSPFFVKCEAKEGGGWTLILNRRDGSVDFDLGWKEYKDGFGNIAREFWLGLENIYQLSGYQVNELLVELVNSDNEHHYARYKHFGLGSESEGYALKILDQFSGDAANGLAWHAGMKFTTKDKDQDTYKANCANEYTGGWWYKHCHSSHLTGLFTGASIKEKSMCWGDNFHLKQARMMIRPQSD